MLPPIRLNRRQILQHAGAAGVMAFAGPNFSWAADGKVLNIRVRNEYHSFDPLITISETDTVVMHALFERLVEYNTGDTWGWHLGAAEMIEYETPTRLRFRLRPGITWSGGFGDVSVEDFKYSIERIAFTETATNRMEWTQLIEVGVDGPQDGVIIMKAPQSNLFTNTLPRDMAAIVCKEAMEEIGGKFTLRSARPGRGRTRSASSPPPRVPWCSFRQRGAYAVPQRRRHGRRRRGVLGRVAFHACRKPQVGRACLPRR